MTKTIKKIKKKKSPKSMYCIWEYSSASFKVLFSLSVFLLIVHVIFWLRPLVVEPLLCGGGWQCVMVAILCQFSLSGLLHKLLDLHWQSAELVLVLLVQIALQLKTEICKQMPCLSFTVRLWLSQFTYTLSLKEIFDLTPNTRKCFYNGTDRFLRMGKHLVMNDKSFN